tara:strand:- start:254 stop:616 length:363 start_codon:yes stop_codon:yes gene_type:complete
MSMLDKLKFWKKGDEFSDLELDRELGLESDSNVGLDLPTTDEMPQASPRGMPPKAFQEERGSNINPFEAPKETQPIQQVQPQGSVQKDLEIISAKLDAIRSTLEAMNHRLNSLEQKEKRW